MSKLFSDNAVSYDPVDVVLDRETALTDFSHWLLSFMGFEESDPQPKNDYLSGILERIRDMNLLRDELSPLFDKMEDGDTLWLCRSRKIGPLIGHRGIALVRDGRPIVYIRVINH